MMKSFVVSVTALFVTNVIVLTGPVYAATANAGKNSPTIMGVIDNSPKESFESKVLPWLQKQIENCKTCEVKNLSPYDDKGQFDIQQVTSVLQTRKTEISFLFISWNEKISSQSQAMLDSLKALANEGFLIVGPAGVPRGNEASAPLSRTLLGQIPDALIIGELGERDRLIASSYFGPEMLTAIRPPKDLLGQGYSPALFATRLAVNFNKKTPSDWIAHIKGKKAANRRIWLGLDDLFNR